MELIHYNIVNNNYQHDLRDFYAFVSDQSFNQLLDISPKNLCVQLYIFNLYLYL